MMSKKMHQNDLVNICRTYPTKFEGLKPIQKQIMELGERLGLDTIPALKLAENLPKLKSFVPKHALPYVGWAAVTKAEVLRKIYFPHIPKTTYHSIKYSHAVDVLIDRLEDQFNFKNMNGNTMRLRTCHNSEKIMEKIAKVQNSDIYIVAVQLGILHNTPQKKLVFAENEFGITTLMGLSIFMTHPNRIDQGGLCMNFSGDSMVVKKEHKLSILFHFSGKSNWAIGCPSDSSGAVTFFVPPYLMSSFF